MTAQQREIEQYNAHRPEYPPSLWGLFATYHRGPLSKAHDIGAGFGNGIEGLLRFLGANGQGLSHAILTEPKLFLVDAARARLPCLFPDTAFGYRNKRGEDAWDAPLGLGSGQMDLVMSCEAIHWTILTPTLEQIYQSLRPGGTFGAVLYAPLPNVVDNMPATMALRCLVEQHVDKLVKENWMDEGWKRCMRQLHRGLDGLPLIHGQWEDVKLIELNSPDGWWCPGAYKSAPALHETRKASYDEKGGTLSLEPTSLSKVRRIVVTVDTNWRRTVASSEWLKEMLVSFQLNFSDAAWKSHEWKEVERCLDGKNVQLEWPAHILLARKSD